MFSRAQLPLDQGLDHSAVRAPRPSTRDGGGGGAALLIGLQRSAGNSAVTSLLHQRAGTPSSPSRPLQVQRCGPVPCDCSDDERWGYAAEHPTESDGLDVTESEVVAPVQRQPAPVTAGGRQLAEHERAHVVQPKIGTRVQRQMPIPLRVGLSPLSTLHEAAKEPPEVPFATAEESDAVEDALEMVLLPAEKALFGSEVEQLWATYLSRRPHDSLVPIRFDSPDSEIVQGFAQSYATQEYHDDFLMKALWAVMPDFCSSLPTDEYLEVPVDHLLPEFVLAHDVIWGDAFDLPANIAGESGSSDAGPDTRRLSGSITILRLTDEEGHTSAIEVEPHFRLTVTDAIDFHPGNLGAGWQEMFTVPMSRLEASGAAYDLPFVVEFDMLGTPTDAPAAVIDECNAQSAPEGPVPSESGTPEPDCSTRVNDVFLLGAINANPERPECSFAQIHERKDHSRYRQYRADRPLPATPCEQGDPRNHDFWLGGRWRILDITTTGVTVMNACGDEESLGIDTGT